MSRVLSPLSYRPAQAACYGKTRTCAPLERATLLLRGWGSNPRQYGLTVRRSAS